MVRFFNFCEAQILMVLDRFVPRLGEVVRRYHRVIKYIFSGGTAAVIDLSLLYLLTDGFGLHYIASTTLAFLAAFGVSFSLQKFWTFGDESMERVHTQLAMYLIIAVINLFVNAGFMYVLVDIAGVWYFLAQIITGATMACYGFLLYRHIIFRKYSHEISRHNPES